MASQLFSFNIKVYHCLVGLNSAVGLASGGRSRGREFEPQLGQITFMNIDNAITASTQSAFYVSLYRGS